MFNFRFMRSSRTKRSAKRVRLCLECDRDESPPKIATIVAAIGNALPNGGGPWPAILAFLLVLMTCLLLLNPDVSELAGIQA